MLGKGLESLIPKRNQGQQNADGRGLNADLRRQQNSGQESVVIEETIIEKSTNEIPVISGPIFHIEIEKIILNPYQPRKEFNEEALKELATSIREFGILQPLVVSKLEEEIESGTKVTYQLIAGQRRLMASKIAGLKTVPVIIRNSTKKAEALEMAIVENIQRADLNVIETARAYSRLSEEFGLTQREIAARLGKSRELVANTMRLLALPTEVQEAISSGKINESQARLLLQVEDAGKQKEFFDKIINQGLSVRDLKKIISQKAEVVGEGSQDAPLRVDDLEMKSLERDLSDFLGAPVKIEFSRSGGKITIHFYSPEEAMGIAQKIKPIE